MKTKLVKAPAFVVRAERALRRAAHNVKVQNRSLGLPVIVWQNGQVVETPACRTARRQTRQR